MKTTEPRNGPAVADAVDLDDRVGGTALRLPEIVTALVCEIDRLHDSPPEGHDLYIELLGAYLYQLAGELDELLAAAGRSAELEISA
jgi:hypothetical protein